MTRAVPRQRTTSRPTRRRQQRPAPGWWSWLQRWPESLREALLLGVVVVLALLVRWPYLLRLPHFTDELGEVRWALGIANGEHFPLIGQETYLGALHAYLLAGCLWLLGPSVALPRILICVFGALTVALTYLLGRALVNRAVGLLAAGLLLTLPQHILVNSHVAWQNSTTPFYTTLALWALLKAVAAQRAETVGRAVGWFALAGFALGLALQTHVGIIVLAPAVVLAVIWACWPRERWSLLRQPGPWVGLVAALLGSAPFVGYNLVNNFVGVTRVQRSRGYAFESDHSLPAYVRNLRNLLLELARMLSTPFQVPEHFSGYLLSPHLVLLVLLCGVGLWLLLRRGQPLPLLALLSTALMMPYFNHAYGVDGDRPIVTGRYVAFLLPPLLVAVALAVVTLLTRGWHWWQQQRLVRSRRLREASGIVAATVVVLALVLYPLLPLANYYQAEAARDPANATFLATLQTVRAARSATTPLYLDRTGLFSVDLKDGASAFEILDVLLLLDQIPHTVTRRPLDELRPLQAQAAGGNAATQPLIIMLRDECWAIRDQLPLQRVSGRLVLRELYPTVPSYYAVYRLVGPGEPAGCLPPGGATPGD